MEGDESDRQASFKVQDRRRFAATGEAREDVHDEPAGASAPAEPPPQGEPAPAAGGEAPQAADSGPGITFASFVFSLSTQALVHLGEIPDPADGVTRLNLDGARHIIDILAVLNEKTAGNLDAAESSLLGTALYDLRMRYVDRARHR
jgi:hypothetical protein